MHNKPTGNEMRVGKAFQKLFKPFNAKYKGDGNYSGVDINLGHALEGVRCNGRQRMTTIIDAWNALKEARVDLDIHISDLRQEERELSQLSKKLVPEMRTLHLCPDCKGAKGIKVKRTNGGRITLWDDCDSCNGRGVR